jgi:hypothetical protein
MRPTATLVDASRQSGDDCPLTEFAARSTPMIIEWCRVRGVFIETEPACFSEFPTPSAKPSIRDKKKTTRGGH